MENKNSIIGNITQNGTMRVKQNSTQEDCRELFRDLGILDITP